VERVSAERLCWRAGHRHSGDGKTHVVGINRYDGKSSSLYVILRRVYLVGVASSSLYGEQDIIKEKLLHHEQAKKVSVRAIC